jgi:hypothetical protein
VVDHVNNLLAAGELKANQKKKAAHEFALKMADSFLDPSSVSAYEFSPKGLVRNIMDANRKRIATTTFGDVSSSLENLYSDLIGLKGK